MSEGANLNGELHLNDLLDRSRDVFEQTRQAIENGTLHPEHMRELANQSDAIAVDSATLIARLKTKR